MTKKIVKLAVIRSDDDAPCPFGLSVSCACKSVGELVVNMAPVMASDDMDSEDKERIININNHIFMWGNPGNRCVYAGMLFGDKKVVECNWAANDAGCQQKGALVGSPFYYKHFSGGLDGVFSYPLAYYDDNLADRLWYGMYSLESVGSKNE